jgi:rhodanese-related sulfurtransferase/CBS domain-containing protein
MPESIALAQLQGLLADGVQLVDVLPPEEYAAEHLPGAVNVPLKQLDAETTAQLDQHRPVAVYCYDALCDMSPRAAWRLETLGFERVYHYVGGKADWLAHALPREGQDLVPHAGELVEPEPPTCLLSDSVADVRAALDGSRYGFCLVTTEHRIVLGRVRRSALNEADPSAAAESVMEGGPSTVRPNTNARELIERLAKRDLRTAIVTTPEGRLIGVFHRADAERRLAAQRDERTASPASRPVTHGRDRRPVARPVRP